MANMNVKRASTAPCGAASELTTLQPAYARNSSSAERALPAPLQEMPVLEPRQRRVRPSEPATEEPETLAGSNQGNTPKSTGNQESNQGPQTSWSPLAACIRFFGKLKRRPLSNLSDHVVVDPNASNQDDFYADIEYKKVEGYPKRSIVQLAALLESNDNFCMFRRFGTETVRLLNVKAIELDQLARKIDELDKSDGTNEGTGYRLDSVEHHTGWDTEQKGNLQDYEEKIGKYYDLLLKYIEVRSLDKPSTRDYHSIYNWIKQYEPICAEESCAMLRKDDFVSTKKAPRSHRSSRIEKVMESYASRHPRSYFNNLLRGKDEIQRTSDPLVHHLSPSRLAIIARVITAVLAVGTMLIPVFVIFLVQPSREVMVSVVAVFVTIVMVTISLVVEVSAQDVFLGMAAYSAVLVALLSNMMNQGNGVCKCSN